MLVSFQNFGVSHRQKQILSAISLVIMPGEKVAIVGASGAGKSTLLSEIHHRLSDRSALCPQQLGLVDALSVYHNIYMGQLEQHNVLANMWNLFFPLPGARREISVLAERFGIQSLLSQPTGKLSGGERQRVALARACYRQQPVFIGDEPVSGLDPEQGEALLIEVFGRHNTAVVALHNPELALSVFDRVIGLRQGQLAFDLPVTRLTIEQLNEFYREG